MRLGRARDLCNKVFSCLRVSVFLMMGGRVVLVVMWCFQSCIMSGCMERRAVKSRGALGRRRRRARAHTASVVSCCAPRVSSSPPRRAFSSSFLFIARRIAALSRTSIPSLDRSLGLPRPRDRYIHTHTHTHRSKQQWRRRRSGSSASRWSASAPSSGTSTSRSKLRSRRSRSSRRSWGAASRRSATRVRGGCAYM